MLAWHRTLIELRRAHVRPGLAVATSHGEGWFALTHGPLTVAAAPREDAAVPLAGSLLAPGQITADTPPGEGEVLVPMPVSAERLPAGGVHAGDRLLVVDAPSAGSDPLPTAPETFEVTVVRIGEPDMNGLSVLDVAADEDDGPGLATRAASGRFALVLLDGGGE